MRTDLRTMGCGECGCFEYRIYQMKDESGLVLECTKCKSVTVAVARADMELNWGEEYGMKSDGILCQMEREK